MIYFIQEDEGGPIKIGYTADVDRRMRHLQISNAKPLRLIKSVSGDSKLERQLHRQFKLIRIRGEWFHPSTDLLAFIASLVPKYESHNGKAFAVIYRRQGSNECEPCPFCERRHQHSDGDGHRSPHCGGETKPIIQAADGTKLRMDDGYIVRTIPRNTRNL